MMTPPCLFDESTAHIGSQAEKNKILQLLFFFQRKKNPAVLLLRIFWELTYFNNKISPSSNFYYRAKGSDIITEHLEAE